MKKSVLIVDDEEKFAFFVAEFLKDEGYETTVVPTGADALKAFSDGAFGLVLLDLKLPDRDGIEVLKQIRERSDCPVVIITAFGSIKNAVAAVRAGASDYLVKPFEMEELLLVCTAVLERMSLGQELRFLKDEKEQRFRYIVGEALVMDRILALARKAAAAEGATVLLEGESGSGKGYLARFIHQQSSRAEGPFVEISCAIPDTLLESELFGYEAGAFTDAKRSKPGLVEVGNRGTIFLDEVADLSASAQAKLLRVLEAKTFKRLGGIKDIATDARIVAASNKNLREAVAAGGFRLDLYYRLAVIDIKLPPLRTRKEDIPFFVRAFAADSARTLKKRTPNISAPTMDILAAYPWPGNIRELRNAIERAVILAEGDDILPRHILLDPVARNPATGAVLEIPETFPAQGISLPSLVGGFEKEMIKKALALTGGNQIKAAKLLGISRHILVYAMRKYGIIA